MNYFIAYIIEVISGYTCCFILATVNSFFFGVCWYIAACLEDLLELFEKMDDLVGRYEGCSLKKSFNERFSEAVLFHSRIIRFLTKSF